MRHSGTIKSWNDEKGYGYVTSVGNGQPVCLHVRNFERRGQRPRQGMKVEFEIGSDVQGRCCATRVRLQGQTASIDIRFNPGLVGLALIALLALWWVGFAGFIPMLITLAVTFMSMLSFFTGLTNWLRNAATDVRRKTRCT
jgi:cold shock CspA family protein